MDVVIQRSEIGQFADQLGVFANRDFSQGEIVLYWNVRVLTEEEFLLLPAYERDNFCHKRDGKIFLYPDPARHVNRSKNPNLSTDFEHAADRAARDIKKGEELSIPEYLKEDF